MSAPVLVAGSYKNAAFIVLLVLGGLFTLLSALAGAFQWFEPWPTVAVAATCCLFASLVGNRIKRARRWIEPTPTGFIVYDHAGAREFADGDVSTMATAFKRNYHNGVLKSLTRKAALEVLAGDAVERVEMSYAFPLGKTDPLGGVFERLLKLLADRAREDLEAGYSLTGEGWELDREGLHFGTGAERELIRYGDMAEVSVVDEKVCVWEAGKPQAAFKVPSGSTGALVLGTILQERVEANASTRKEPVEEEGLGRILFERDKSLTPGVFVFLMILGLGAILGGLGMVVGGLVIDEPPLLLVGAGVAVVGLLIVWATRANRVNVFRCQKAGVCKTTSRGTQQMKYSEVGEFTWSATRMYYNGAYTGTTLNVTFRPLPGSNAQPITYSANIKGDDAELENLRVFIAKVIAQRMLEELRAGRPADWTPTLRFLPDGLEYRAKTTFGGKKPPVLIPFIQISGQQLHEGYLFLYTRGEKKPKVQEAVSQSNFFPGYELLLFILYAPPQQPAAPPEGGAGAEPAREE